MNFYFSQDEFSSRAYQYLQPTHHSPSQRLYSYQKNGSERLIRENSLRVPSGKVYVKKDPKKMETLESEVRTLLGKRCHTEDMELYGKEYTRQ